jgi:hypothetical protein
LSSHSRSEARERPTPAFCPIAATFQLAVTLPDAAPQVFPGQPLDPGFQRQQIFVFVLQLSGTEPGTCWLDDLRVETAE